MKKWLAAITPCSIAQWLRLIAVGIILLAMATGYTFGQAELNVKLKTGSNSLRFLQDPSGARLAADHPLNAVANHRALRSETTQKASENNLNQVYTLKFDQGNAQERSNALMATGDFEWVEPNRTVQIAASRPNDSQLNEQWYHPFVKTFEAWETTRGNSNVVIGVLDTGLDYWHPEFEGQIAVKASEDANGNGRFEPWPSSDTIDGLTGDLDGVDDDLNGYVDDVIGYDFTDQPRSPFGGDYLFEDADPMDDNDHGTLVAGIIAAKEDNGLGGAGIAPGCRLKALRAFAASGGGEDDDIARAIVYAADEGIQILNFSFGDIYPSQMMHAAIRYAESKGVVMIASAGNGTGDNLHYPSNFDEVISVSASALGSDSTSEFLWPLSSFGWTVSLCAPGSGIFTTVVSDSGDVSEGFGTFSGTSTAAPMVAATVGLLFSQRGACSPQQVRGILTSSADDISSEGWDHLTGAGRLNIQQALEQVGGSNVQILNQPATTIVSPNSAVVMATVLDPQFQAWVLEYQPGLEGDDDWIEIGNGSEQVQSDTLLTWQVGGLAEGEYTLRLRVDKSNGSTAEDRVRFVLDRSGPQVEVLAATHCWDNEEQKLLVVYRSDDRGTSRLDFRRPGTPLWNNLAFDRITRNGHFVLGGNLLPDGPIEWRIATVNEAGLQGYSTVDTFDFTRDFLPQTGFDTLTYDLPMGHYLGQTLDLDNDGLREVVLSEYNEQLSFGKVKHLEFNGVQFSELDSLSFKSILIPKDVRDTDGNNLLELLVSVNDSIYVLEQATSGEFMKEEVRTNLGNGYFPARFVDADQDGTVEILAKDFADYKLLSPTASGYSLSQELPDASPDYIGSVAPKALTGDFDQDGRQEIVFGDFDGDLLIYEFNGSGYDLTFVDTTLLTKSGSYLAQGDFDGDGVEEIAVGIHASLNRNEEDFEYEAPYWQVRIFKSTANNQYAVIGSSFFYDIDTDGFNAFTAGNVDSDPADELVFSTFPRTYILEWENGELEPGWFHYGDLTTHHLIEDFNGNGVNEIAIGRGDKAVFWEKDVQNTGPQVVSWLDGWSLDSSQTELEWSAVSNATEYRVWRGELDNGPLLIAAIDSSSNTTYKDTGLDRDQRYIYLVEAKNPGLSPPYSAFSSPLVLRPHVSGKLVSVFPLADNQALAKFSVPVKARPEDMSLFLLNGVRTPWTLISSGDNNQELHLSWDDPFFPSNRLEVDTRFLDADRGRLDTNGFRAFFNFNPVVENQAHFTHWEVRGPQQAQIWFNLPMTSSVLDASLYELAPLGDVSSVEWADASQSSILVNIETAALGALGYPVSIILNGGVAQDGSQMSEKEGNVATFSEFKDELDEVYVYPNPYQGNDQFTGIRFANLAQTCTVTVYTASGRKVASLEETNGDGGLEWNLLNTAGERIRPGNYLYRVETPEGVGFVGTFSILQ